MIMATASISGKAMTRMPMNIDQNHAHSKLRPQCWKSAVTVNPPRHGEGDHEAKRNGGGGPRWMRGRGGGGAHGGCGGEVGPLHHPSDGPPPRFGEDFKERGHSAASLNWTPRTSSSE